MVHGIQEIALEVQQALPQISIVVTRLQAAKHMVNGNVRPKLHEVGRDLLYVINEGKRAGLSHLVLQLVHQAQHELHHGPHGGRDVADQQNLGLELALAILQLQRHASVLQVGAQRALHVQLTDLAAPLAQGRPAAQLRGQALHLFAQLFSFPLAQRLEGTLQQVIAAQRVLRLVEGIARNAAADVLTDLFTQGILVGLHQLAQAIQGTLVHAHAVQQFPQFLERLLDLVIAQGAQHAAGQPGLLVRLRGAVQPDHAPQLLQLLLRQRLAAQ